MFERRDTSRRSFTRYLELQRSHPHLFDNPASEGFRIVLDEGLIREVEERVAKRLRDLGQPPEWANVGIVYEDQYLLILRDAVLFPDGQRETYIRILESEERGPGVAVLATLAGRVILLRHFRHATREWHLEIPRGFGSKGGSPEEDARRELAEEMGGVSKVMAPLGVMHPNTGLSAEVVHLWYAELESVGRPQAHEAISEVVEVSVAELERMIGDGIVTDSFTVGAYARARFLRILGG